MGMQIMPLSVGNAVSHAELHKERRPLLPAEQAAAAKQAEALSLESNKTVAVDLLKTASDLERISLAFNRRLRFEIDHESREILIKVIDTETDKVIKELPPEELRRLHSSLRETIGFLIDRTV
ncbi:MAG: flagellar protein FlaG [Treponema sp.]|nr:flagellar protein FlaG [Treponema sp.]